MWDLVENPEDRFSQNEAQFQTGIDYKRKFSIIAEVQYAEIHTGHEHTHQFDPRCEKTGLRGSRPGPTQTGLYNHRRWLEA